MVLLDLQKAFDTVNHEILLSKLQCMGLIDTAVKWFTSYLTGRTQVCEVEGTTSDPELITCGEPQGSILGPLSFLAYINDILATVACKLRLYADDPGLLIPGGDVHEIENTLGKELEMVSQWLIDTKLSIYLGITESIFFLTKRKESKTNALKIMCNGIERVSKSSITYLGLTLEQSLTCGIIAAQILAKCASKLRVFVS